MLVLNTVNASQLAAEFLLKKKTKHSTKMIYNTNQRDKQSESQYQVM